MGRIKHSINELVKMVTVEQSIRLPEMQRGYVWKATKVRDFIDSLYRGYPVGSLLMWRPESKDLENIQTRDFDLSIKPDNTDQSNYLLLLDGQQRLTSLCKLLTGHKVEVKTGKGKKTKEIDIIFNLDHPEGLIEQEIPDDNVIEVVTEADDDQEDDDDDEVKDNKDRTFMVAGDPNYDSQKNWISLKDFFKSKDNLTFLEENGFKLDDPNIKKYNNRLTTLRNVLSNEDVFDIVELKNLSYEEVTEIFVRVNSAGTKLSGSDLALAQITAKWRGALKLFEAFQDVCDNKGWSISVGIIVRALVAIITNQSKFKTVSKISLQDFEKGWDDTKRAVTFALDYLKDNLHVDNIWLLSSPYFVVQLAHYFNKKGYEILPEEERKLNRWFVLANSKGRYSRGSSEGMLDQDLKAVNPDELLSNLQKQFGKLSIDYEDLEGRSTTSGYFKTMFVAMKMAGAKDFISRQVIDINHTHIKDKIEFHHIIPKDLLQKAGYPKEERNDIANMAFISKRTNLFISNKRPTEYIPNLIDTYGSSMFDPHGIPLQPELWELENYKNFLRTRRETIVKIINNYMESVSKIEA